MRYLDLKDWFALIMFFLLGLFLTITIVAGANAHGAVGSQDVMFEPDSFAQVAIESNRPMTWAAAKERATKEYKPILVLVSADWCPGCRKAKAFLGTAPLSGVYYVIVNVDRDRDLAKSIGKESTKIPVLVGYKKCGDQWQRGAINPPVDPTKIRRFLERLQQCDLPAKSTTQPALRTSGRPVPCGG